MPCGAVHDLLAPTDSVDRVLPPCLRVRDDRVCVENVLRVRVDSMADISAVVARLQAAACPERTCAVLSVTVDGGTVS